MISAVGTGALLVLEVATLASGISAQNTECYLEGKMYDGLPQLPNSIAMYRRTPEECLKACKIPPFPPSVENCTGWTWKAAAEPAKLLGPGGCWLVPGDSPSNLIDVNLTDNAGRVVSGEMECFNKHDSAVTTLPNNTNGTVNVTEPSVTVPIVTDGNVTNDTNNTNPVPGNLVPGSDEKSEDGGSGIPAWLIVLIVLGLLGICGALIFSQMGGGSEKKKKKKSKTSTKRIVEAAPEPQVAPVEAAPLLVEEAPAQAPVMPVLQANALPAPVVPAGAPVLSFQGMSPTQQQQITYMQPQQMTYAQPQQMVYTMQPQYPGSMTR